MNVWLQVCNKCWTVAQSQCLLTRRVKLHILSLFFLLLVGTDWLLTAFFPWPEEIFSVQMHICERLIAVVGVDWLYWCGDELR